MIDITFSFEFCLIKKRISHFFQFVLYFVNEYATYNKYCTNTYNLDNKQGNSSICLSRYMKQSQGKVIFCLTVLIFLLFLDVAVPPTALPENKVEQDGKDTIGSFFLFKFIWSMNSLTSKLAFCVFVTITTVKAAMQIPGFKTSKIDWWIPFGFIIGLSGWIFRAWSKYILGENFSYQIKVPTDGHLISDGPYKYIVHPGYLGFFFHVTGLFMVCRINQRLIVALIVAVIAGVYLRIHEENAMLKQHLGEVWEAHISDKYLLFPFIF